MSYFDSAYDLISLFWRLAPNMLKTANFEQKLQILKHGLNSRGIKVTLIIKPIYSRFTKERINMKFKKWLIGIAVFAIMAVLGAVGAGAVEIYGDYGYEVLDNNSVEIVRYSGTSKAVQIPSTINGKRVTRIGNSAFNYCLSVESVVMPDSVTSIGVSAFNMCCSLKNVTLSANITEIGNNAFAFCFSVENVQMPDKLKRIGDGAFTDCYRLKSIRIPKSVEYIGESAFLECTALSEINVISGNKKFSSSAGILYNSNKTELICYPVGKAGNSFTVPNSVTSLADYAFSGTELKSVTISDHVKTIGRGVFKNCTLLANIKIPEKIVEMDTYEDFSNCASLVSIKLPVNITCIGEEMFKDCSSLKYITIPDSVTYIERNAFNYCRALNTVIIPNRVQCIESGAFSSCDSLAKINIPESVNYIGQYAFNGTPVVNNQKTAVRYIGKWVIDSDDVKNVYINAGTVGIASGAFMDRSTIENVTMPDTVRYIGDFSFSSCKSLKNVALSNRLVDIGYCAFSDCRSIEKINLPGTVENIANKAFADCTSLKNIKIPDSVTKIGASAFENTAIVNNQSSYIKYIDKWAVDCDAQAVRASVKSGIKNIADGTFKDCYYLETAVIPNSVSNIGEYVFFNCMSLKQIDIPKGITGISKGMFGNCSSLTAVAIPDNITVIEEGAFNGCKALKNVSISDKVKSIAAMTFYNCPALKSIKIPKSVSEIGKAAFGFCSDSYSDNDIMIDNYKIYCYSGTAGEKYAKSNNFKYELVTVVKPSDVSNFKVKSKTSTAVTLQWNKNSSASGYEIEQYKGGKWTNVAKITGNATTSYTVKGLAAGTAGYKFRMRAVKDGAYSDYTSVLTVNTNPYGVSGFKCSSKTSTSVTLKWNKGTTASGYQLQQYKDGKWVTIYTGTKATNTSYTVKGLKAGTAGYRFRIRAYKTYGNTKQYGSWSSEVKVNTNPYGVGGFKVKSTAKTSITLGWNKGTTASGYQLQQYKGGKWVTVYTGTKATSTSCTVKNLKKNTSYKFRIRAYKTYGNTKQYGSWSKELTVRTKR